MDSSECPICGADVPFTGMSSGEDATSNAARQHADCPGCGTKLVRNPDEEDFPDLQKWRTVGAVSDDE